MIITYDYVRKLVKLGKAKIAKNTVRHNGRNYLIVKRGDLRRTDHCLRPDHMEK